MSDVMIPYDNGSHPLRDEPLPVRIPPGVLKYPREWCLNSGHPIPTDPIPRNHIYEMEFFLSEFVEVSQGVLIELVYALTDGISVVPCNGRQVPFLRFFHFAKYGSKKDKRLQEDALSLLKKSAEERNFTLGEVKALLFVASRNGLPMGAMGEVKHELAIVQKYRELLNGKYFTTQLTASDWGGDLMQFKPILEKAVDYYEKVLIPKWCYDFKYDTID